MQNVIKQNTSNYDHKNSYNIPRKVILILSSDSRIKNNGIIKS